MSSSKLHKGRDVVQFMDPRTDDPQCPLTFGTPKIMARIRPSAEATVALTWTHHKTVYRSDKLLVRIMAYLPTHKDAELFDVTAAQEAPTLPFVRPQACTPCLLTETEHLEAGNPYNDNAVRRILAQYAEREGAAQVAARAAFERRGVDVDAAAEAKAVVEVMGVEETKGGEAQTEVEVTAPAPAGTEEAKDDTDAPLTTEACMMSIPNALARIGRSDHKIAAVVLVLDEDEEGELKEPQEPVLFVLQTFASHKDFLKWANKARRWVRRYPILDVPLWQWFDPIKRARDRSVHQIMRHPLQQRVFDQLEKQSKWDAGDEVDEEDEELRPFPMADEATAAAHGMDPTLLEEARSAMAAFMKEDDS